MKKFDSNYIEKLVDIMKNNELTEVTLDDSECSLFIKSNGYTPVIKEKVEQEVNKEVIEPVVEEEVVEEVVKNLVPVCSNMIGIFYSKPSADAEPFVKVGDDVKEGQQICTIETVKIMNKITSDVSGKVAEICIEDGKPVEYGQVIMYVEQ